MQSNDLSDFRLEQCVFEARYEPSYLLWDHAGSIWSQIRAKWPRLKLSQVEPSATQFTLDSRFNLSVFVDKFAVIDQAPDQSLKSFLDVAESLSKVAIHHLEINEFSRLGLRLIFFKEFSDREAASTALLSSQILNLPDGPHFGIDMPPVLPGYTVRWESKATGTTVRIEAEGRIIDFTPPHFLDLRPMHKEVAGLKFDIDYYTVASVTVGQFSCRDWINQAWHLVNRDSKPFLTGRKQ